MQKVLRAFQGWRGFLAFGASYGVFRVVSGMEGWELRGCLGLRVEGLKGI